jgi:RecA/RadA recombinase
MLDLAISNRPNGGFPVGRIIEITGLEASGKSLLAAHALANTQKKVEWQCISIQKMQLVENF